MHQLPSNIIIEVLMRKYKIKKDEIALDKNDVSFCRATTTLNGHVFPMLSYSRGIDFRLLHSTINTIQLEANSFYFLMFKFTDFFSKERFSAMINIIISWSVEISSIIETIISNCEKDRNEGYSEDKVDKAFVEKLSILLIIIEQQLAFLEHYKTRPVRLAFTLLFSSKSRIIFFDVYRKLYHIFLNLFTIQNYQTTNLNEKDKK